MPMPTRLEAQQRHAKYYAHRLMTEGHEDLVVEFPQIDLALGRIEAEDIMPGAYGYNEMRLRKSLLERNIFPLLIEGVIAGSLPEEQYSSAKRAIEIIAEKKLAKRLGVNLEVLRSRFEAMTA